MQGGVVHPAARAQPAPETRARRPRAPGAPLVGGLGGRERRSARVRVRAKYGRLHARLERGVHARLRALRVDPAQELRTFVEQRATLSALGRMRPGLRALGVLLGPRREPTLLKERQQTRGERVEQRLERALIARGVRGHQLLFAELFDAPVGAPRAAPSRLREDGEDTPCCPSRVTQETDPSPAHSRVAGRTLLCTLITEFACGGHLVGACLLLASAGVRP